MFDRDYSRVCFKKMSTKHKKSILINLTCAGTVDGVRRSKVCPLNFLCLDANGNPSRQTDDEVSQNSIDLT